MTVIKIIKPEDIADIAPILGTQPTEYIADAKKRTGADIIINGGLFTMANGATESALKIDGLWIKRGKDVYGLGMTQGKAELVYLPASGETKHDSFIAAYCTLVRNGKVDINTTDANVTKTPRGRTAIGGKADGALVIYVCQDGPDQLTGPELAQKMLGLGCVWALNLDGGGSSAYLDHDITLNTTRKLDNFIGLWLVNGITADYLSKAVQTKIGCGYAYGSLGQVLTDGLISDFAKRNPAHYTDAYRAKCRAKWLNKQVFDCIGLIKYHVWGNEKVWLPRTYVASEDINADTAYNKATVKGAIATMPDIPGLCVHMGGHIGVYIGGGYVVEARGVDYGVVKTALKDRPWVHWLQYPGVVYGTQKTEPIIPATIKRGSKGYAVEKLQTALNKTTTLKVDSDFGPKTEAAVIVYQKANKLTADGIVGPITWGKLLG